MVEFLLPGRGGGWPFASVPQNKLLLPWMIFACLAHTVSPICSKSSQVKFFVTWLSFFFYKVHTMSQYSNTNCFLFPGKEHLCSERLRQVRTSSWESHCCLYWDRHQRHTQSESPKYFFVQIHLRFLSNTIPKCKRDTPISYYFPYMGLPNRLFPNISSLFNCFSKYTCIRRCLTKTSRWPWTPISLWSGGTPEWSSPTIWTGLVLRIPKLEQEKRNMKYEYKFSGATPQWMTILFRDDYSI